MISPLEKEKLLLAVHASLSQTLDLPLALQRALLAMRGFLPADGVFANIFLKERRCVQFLAHSTADCASQTLATVPIPELLARSFSYQSRKACLVVDDVQTDPITCFTAPKVVPDIASYIMLRLVIDGQHVGVICFYSKRPARFSEEQAALLSELHNPFALNVGFALMQRLQGIHTALEAENARLRERLSSRDAAAGGALREILEHTPSLAPVCERVQRVAPYEATVLITGESGSGKEVIANAVHQLSRRKDKPFVSINCASLPESIVESELFGYEKGAFTDAKSQHAGIFEQADGGTLFLDEVGELPLDVQAKLLRVLQDRTVRRLGGSRDIALDVRVIAATNRPLEKMVRAGEFRADLYYRLNVFPIALKPLRERHEDILPLSSLFLRMFAKKYEMPFVPRLSPAALQEACRWSWPGNIRELRNVMARAVLEGEPVISSLPLLPVADDEEEARPARLASSSPEKELPPSSFDEMQRTYFKQLLSRCHGKISGPGGAAEIAGMHHNTLRSRLKKLGLLP